MLLTDAFLVVMLPGALGRRPRKMSYNPFLLSSRTVDATVPIVLTVNATVPADTAVSLLHAGDAGCAGAASSYAVVTEDHEARADAAGCVVDDAELATLAAVGGWAGGGEGESARRIPHATLG